MWRFLLIVICSFAWSSPSRAQIYATRIGTGGSINVWAISKVIGTNGYSVTYGGAFWSVNWNPGTFVASAQGSSNLIRSNLFNPTIATNLGLIGGTVTAPNSDFYSNSVVAPSWAKDSVFTARDSATGQILYQSTIKAGTNDWQFYANKGTAVDIYYNNILLNRGGYSNSPVGSFSSIESSQVGMNVLAPGVGAGVVSPNGVPGNLYSPGAGGTGSINIAYQISYQGGGNLGIPTGTVVSSGYMASTSSGASLVNNLGLPAGAIYRVNLVVPQFAWQMSDGMNVLIVTNYVTNTLVSNIPAGESGSYTFSGSLPATPGVGTNGPVFTNSHVSTNSFAQTTVRTVTISNPASGSPGESASATIEDLEFEQKDFGEQLVISQAAGLVSKAQTGLQNFQTGFNNLSAAATAIASLQPPGVSGSCTLQIGPYTISLGGGAFSTVRAVAGYLVALIALFGAGRMIWDSLSG